jgi:hypothetical protein
MKFYAFAIVLLFLEGIINKQEPFKILIEGK